MKFIILSDYFDEKAESYLKSFCKSNYNKSGIFYQHNLFTGFEKTLGEQNVKMYCCPTCGTYPNESRLFWSPAFKSDKESIEYVGFINILYLRNIFRYIGLKKHLKKYLRTLPKDEKVFVLVIQMHHPFMKALRYIRRFFPTAKACINIWDYPNFVDFRNNGSLKNSLRKINFEKTMQMLKDYDLFFYLSEGMEELNENKNRYIVHEGILSEEQIREYNSIKQSIVHDDRFHIVFTGRLTKPEGVIDLINAVNEIEDDSIVLEIAGGGEEEAEVTRAAEMNKNIIFHGLLSRDKVIELQCRADLFVLPRLPEDYTNYSFPSKLCEYMVAGKPILTRPLKCFDESLRKAFILFEDEDNRRLPEILRKTINDITSEVYKPDYRNFIRKNLNSGIANEIIDFLLEDSQKT